MRKHTRIFLLISLVLILLISLAACNIPFINPGEPGDTISIPKYYHVVFMVDGKAYCKPIPYLSNTTAKLPDGPTPPEGQDFLGWYLGEEEFTQEDFTTLLLNNKEKAVNKENIVLVAKFGILTSFTITFDEATCGVIAPITEKVGRSIVSKKPNLTKPGCVPRFYTIVDGENKEFIFDKMPNHDITVYVEWLSTATVNYYGDGTLIKTIVVPSTDLYLVEKVEPGEALYDPDCTFDGWYKDSKYKNKLTTESITLEPTINLYGRYTNRSFVGKKLEYGSTSFEKPYRISDATELSHVFDYIFFNGIYAKVNNGTPESGVYIDIGNLDFDSLFTNALKLVTGPNYGILPYSFMDYPGRYLIGMGENITATKTKTIAPTKIPQYTTAMVPVVESKRDETFDAFKINEKEEFYKEIHTSNQLFYAMQYGYKPNCVPGSIAENMLKEAKSILRECVDDTMSDFEKVYAIYCWMVLNVDYDHKALLDQKQPDYNPYNAEAWHMEGVFNSRLAVCDGISKAMVVLCRLEGIPCIRTTGPEHAWNKVYIDVDGEENAYSKQWYSIDATWGDLNISDKYTVLDFDNFLIKDIAKENSNDKTMPCDNQLDIVANTSVNVYKLMKYDGKNDLYIDNDAEFDALIKYLYEYVNTNKTITNITISFDTANGYYLSKIKLKTYEYLGTRKIKYVSELPLHSPGTAKTYILSVA